jgi:Family of unknown function (DUF6401)
MTSDFSAATAPTELAGRAHATLDNLMARVGVDGLYAALTEPGLLAAVDQHATAVRESIRRSGRRFGLPALARYAESVLAAAHRMGRTVPQAGEADKLDWARAEWHLVRLVAVCALAEERGLL